jgi:DnaJ family protein A protein 2
MKHGQKVVLRGEADQLPGTIPGDVIFVLAMEPHSRFQRNNDDLLCAQRITLVEALCGCQFLLEHLDGRKLLCKLVLLHPCLSCYVHISFFGPFGCNITQKSRVALRTRPGEVIKPGHIKSIDEEGMPMHKNPFVKGKLYIKFDIVFPADGTISPQVF